MEWKKIVGMEYGKIVFHSIPLHALLIEQFVIGSDGHDKPFCTKAITIIDNFKKALGDTDNQ